MFKKTAAVFLLTTFLFSAVAQAATVEFVIGQTEMSSIDGGSTETSTLLAAPFIENDRTMIPVRAVSESFGCTVVWEPETRSVAISRDGKSVSLTIDSLTAQADGAPVQLDAAPCIVNDTTFVPVRFVTEALGYNVSFVPRTRSVLVCDQGNYMTVDGIAVTYPEYEAARYIFASAEGLSGEELENYVRSYLTQNAALSAAAAKAGVSLSGQRDTNINLALGYYTSAYPFALGAYARLMESEETGLEYADFIYETYADAPELLAEYENNYLCAKVVLISGGTDSENKALADDVYAQASQGADFDQLVSEYGSDDEMAKNPEGYVFTEDEVIAEFWSAASALEAGETGAPVKSELGYMVVRREPLPPLTDEMKTQLINKMYIDPIIQNCVIE